MMSPPLIKLVRALPVRLGTGVAGRCRALRADACELSLPNPVAAGDPLVLIIEAPGRDPLRFAATPGQAVAREGDRIRQRFALEPVDDATGRALRELLTQLRKDAHLELCLEEDVETTIGPGFERVALPHCSLPDLDGDAVSTATEFLDRPLRLPLVITGMTGGTDRAGEFNLALAAVAQRTGVAMGLGSQRSMLEDPTLARTFQVRDVAPDIPLLANLGAVQLNYGVTPEACARAVEAVDADALCLHLNVVQEMIQPEGNRNFIKIAHLIRKVVDEVAVPVLLKETGTGMSPDVARLAMDVGCLGVDVAGVGGTSWPRVEALRHDDARQGIGEAFRDWGLTTVDAVRGCREAAPVAQLIASGGVRSGLDMARCVALGADMCGMALPLLRAVARSEDAAVDYIEQRREELRVALMCSGARDLRALRDRGPASVDGVDHD